MSRNSFLVVALLAFAGIAPIATADVRAPARIVTEARDYGDTWGIQRVAWEQGIGLSVDIQSMNGTNYTGKRARIFQSAGSTAATYTLEGGSPVAFTPPSGTVIDRPGLVALVAEAVKLTIVVP